MRDLTAQILACKQCSDRFLATHTAHAPRPVVWFQPGARILIAGQAPGMRVFKSGRPFDDPSGDRLREWMGIDAETFYDRARIAILPMAFCFPGYNDKGADLPPPSVCARSWRLQALQQIGEVPLTLLVGTYAQRWHLGGRMSVTDRVAGWRETAPSIFPLPHPSWRNTGWIKRNGWFEADLLPVLRRAVRNVLR